MAAKTQYKPLLDRKIDKTVWEGTIVNDGDWATDGKLMFSLCSIIGPYINQAEKLVTRRHPRQPLRSQDEANRLYTAIERAQSIIGKELGWTTEKAKVDGKTFKIDVHWIEPATGGSPIPLHADYARLLKSFVDYHHVALPIRKGDPVRFFRNGELVAVCSPLKDIGQAA